MFDLYPKQSQMVAPAKFSGVAAIIRITGYIADTAASDATGANVLIADALAQRGWQVIGAQVRNGQVTVDVMGNSEDDLNLVATNFERALNRSAWNIFGSSAGFIQSSMQPIQQPQQPQQTQQQQQQPQQPKSDFQKFLEKNAGTLGISTAGLALALGVLVAITFTKK